MKGSPDAYFDGAWLDGATFRKAHLKGAHFFGAYLTRTDFTDAEVLSLDLFIPNEEVKKNNPTAEPACGDAIGLKEKGINIDACKEPSKKCPYY